MAQFDMGSELTVEEFIAICEKRIESASNKLIKFSIPNSYKK